ncbi:unnamed protein product, partial [Rotaria sp. Silwood2]
TPKPTASGPSPPPPSITFDTSLNTSADDSRNQLMRSINALGESVTSHLKKVPGELKTHKNSQL